MDKSINSWSACGEDWLTERMEIGWGSQTDSCEDINDPAFFVR